MLVQAEGELCVCELMFALGESQPKISRHLALLREAGVVVCRRQGTWMHYRLSEDLPGWSKNLLSETLRQVCSLNPFHGDIRRLRKMPERPSDRACA